MDIMRGALHWKHVCRKSVLGYEIIWRSLDVYGRYVYLYRYNIIMHYDIKYIV